MNLFPNACTLLGKLSVPALQFTIEHKFTITGFTNTCITNLTSNWRLPARA